MTAPAHPIQPLVRDDLGDLRFKGNAIVQFLFEQGPFNMGDLIEMEFSQEDREQFAQLLGYSHRFTSELSYMRDEVLAAAMAEYEHPGQTPSSRETLLQDRLDALREQLRGPMAELFGVHPDALRPEA